MKTALFKKHQALGARIVNFAGFEMPLLYSGILAEHISVRERAGIFDVSHMGLIKVYGPDAEHFLDYLSVNYVPVKDLSATYTVFCEEGGGAVDDLIIYRISSDNFFLVVNASNRQKDLRHLRKKAKGYAVEVEPNFDNWGIIALQGPLAKERAAEVFPAAEDLKPFSFEPQNYQNGEVIVSATGYTGSGGFEIYGPNELISGLWNDFLEKGVVPCGLGARDTLRMEKGYALYGHELSKDIAPTESVSSWTVKFDKEDFLGKKALLKLRERADKRNQYGVVLLDRGVARENYPVFHDKELIGHVTSGTMSPSLRKAIAIVMVKGKLKTDDIIDIEIRNKRVKAKVVKLPFIP